MSYYGSLIEDLHSNSWGYNQNDEFSTFLAFLFDVEFRPMHHMDSIRVEKISDMRDEYRYERGAWASSSEEFPPFATVLELLVSLSRSMEDVMSNHLYGDRTPNWFWMMIDNLGLTNMDNEHFDQEYVVKVLERWLKREFESDGIGSPFPLKHPPCDMTGVDIWRAFGWYMNENYQGRW